jgi:hypothetical protein
VDGEQLVIRFGTDKIAVGSHQVEAKQHRRRAADEKKQGDRHQVEDGDPLVIPGQ